MHKVYNRPANPKFKFSRWHSAIYPLRDETQPAFRCRYSSPSLHQRTLLTMESIGNPHARCVLNGITLYEYLPLCRASSHSDSRKNDSVLRWSGSANDANPNSMYIWISPFDASREMDMISVRSSWKIMSWREGHPTRKGAEWFQAKSLPTCWQLTVEGFKEFLIIENIMITLSYKKFNLW